MSADLDLSRLRPSDSIDPAQRAAAREAAWLQLRPQKGWPLRYRVKSRAARAWHVVRRTFKALRQLATDKRIPRWVRILLAVGCVQIPVLPIDEIALALALTIIAIWYRAPLRDALAVARGRA